MPYRVWDPSTDFHHGVSVHRDEVQRSLGRSRIHTAVVQTLLGLLYNLSNQNLGDTGHEILASIMESPGWDTVLPHLRDVLSVIDSNIMQAIAEGLFKESIRTGHYKMLDLAIGLGVDPTQRIKYFNNFEKVYVISTPLVAICKESSQEARWEEKTPEKLVPSLLRRDQHIPDISLLWIIRASCHTIAEEAIRSQPEREVDFSIAVSDLEEGIWLGFDTHDWITPLLVACSDLRQSAGKLSLVRCLLERNVKADLEAMIAAAGAGDAKVVFLLHQHGSPVNGFIPELGTPLSSACNAALVNEESDLTAIFALLELGATPNDPESKRINRWEHSPLHILALADDRPVVTKALDLLLKKGADINHHTSFYHREDFRGQLRSVDSIPGQYGQLAETALEYAIASSHWISAFQLLSACSELTGREMLLIYSLATPSIEKAIGCECFRKFVRALLAKAPGQAAARHWNGRTILQCAIQAEHEDFILELFAFGVKPMPSDFMCIISDRAGAGASTHATVCRLSTGIQMKLALAARFSQPLVTDVSTIRLILAFACPGVVRNLLEGCPDAYDSAGLCYMIARIASKDKISYFFAHWTEIDEHQEDHCLNIEDLFHFISRRTISNRHEDWESTAVSMAARAGRADILQILTRFDHDDSRRSGFIPEFILKHILIKESDHSNSSLRKFDEANSCCLGIWIEYCRMDDPVMRCCPMTAAAMVAPENTAIEVVELLLAHNYHPDGWTVLIASCRGYLSILQRLRRLESWPHILNHDDRPDWCPTALQIAVYHGRVSIVRFLIDTETMVDAMDLCPSRTFYGHLPASCGLFDQRILPRTALQHAVEKENFELVTILVNAGANINAPAGTDSGATALQIACFQGSILMVQYLLGLGADVHADGAARNGRTALQGAAEHGRKDVVELLAKHTTLAASSHREQLVDAVFYAKKNAQHVVARILRESVFPPWRPEDEETIDMLDEDWESSDGSLALRELKAEIKNWKETFEDWSGSSSAYGGSSNSNVGGEELHVEHPISPHEDGSVFPQGMEWSFEDFGGFDSHGADISQWLALAEEDTTWHDFPSSFERSGDDPMLFDDPWI